MNEYKAELEKIQKRFDDDLNALGARIREELVVPACRKYRLRFLSGNGTFYFHRPGNDASWGNSTDLAYGKLSASAKAALGPVLDLLNEEITHNDYIGFYVGDVK